MKLMTMEIRFKYFIICILAWSGFSCRQTSDFNFEGKWQSLNEAGTVVEFTKDNRIVLYRDGKSFWGSATKHGELTYMIENDPDNWYSFKAYDGDEFFFKGRIELVKGGRIRIYFLKHHDILDLADEYIRTNDFDSFSSILSGILEEPEVEGTK